MIRRPMYPAERAKVERALIDIAHRSEDVAWDFADEWRRLAKDAVAARDWLANLLVVMAIVGTGAAAFLLGLAARP